MPRRRIIPWIVAVYLVIAAQADAQSDLRLITESTATVGRGGAFKSNDSFLAEIVGVADIGLRWVKPSGLGYGFSVLAGRDFPNEASLAGVRGRISQQTKRGMFEGSVAVLSSSMGVGGIGHGGSFGAMVSAAYYPRPFWALVAQVEMVPTTKWRDDDDYEPKAVRDPALSLGLRLADKPGVVPWLGAGILALTWVILNEV